MHKIPTDTPVRNLLDPVSAELLFPVFDEIFAFLFEQGMTTGARSPITASPLG
ncbi:MAG: hypothetical protein ACLFUM_12050 [Spirochaetaceae bacterium]